MGVGFGATARTPAPGGKLMSRGALFDAIRGAVEDTCEDPYLAGLIQFEEHGHELAVALHPGSEPVFFTWNPDGTTAAEAKTSTTGPGYHAYALEVVRAVGRKCGIDWDLSDDETGYATTGNFSALQKQMAEFLAALAHSFLAEPRLRDAPTLAVNMAEGAPIPASGGPWSITPLGPRSRSFWESLKRGEKLQQYAREFYPWWTKDRDAEYYRKTGMVLLWNDVSWRPPTNEHEEWPMRLALDCFERAAELNPDVELPAAEISDLKQLLNMGEDDDFPALDSELTGYYRAVINRRLPGPWTVALPGFWSEEFKDESAMLSMWHADRTAHFSTYDLSPDQSGKPPPTAEEIALPDKESVPEGTKLLKFRKENRVGYYWIEPTEEEDVKAWMLHGCMAVAGSAADVAIWFANANDRDWAIKTFESVTYTGRGDEPEE